MIPSHCRLECATTKPYLVVPENQGMAGSVLVQCAACSLVIESPRPSREKIDAFYSNEALWTNSRDAEGNQRSYVNELLAKRPQFEDLVQRIERFRRGGRLLDVAAGAGLLEKSLDPARWQVVGVESSRYIAEFGARELNTRVTAGYFEDMALEPASFDVVVMKYALDHMERPWDVLVKAREILKPGGLLVIADLINIDSFSARFFAEGHRLFHPMHFTYFSAKTIGTHLQRIGFEVIQVERPFMKTPYCNAKNLRTFAGRVVRRALNKFRGNNEKVFSTAFYGNMIDVFAVASSGNPS